MARMYARKKGKSGSKKPLAQAGWVEFKKEEVERLIVKLAKDNLGSAEIGKTLRDNYGIPSVKSITGKHVTTVMEENNLLPKVPEDLMNLLKQVVKLHEHMKRYKKDSTSKHGLELLESRIRRLVKYYTRIGRLSKDWRYDAERAKLIVQTGG